MRRGRKEFLVKRGRKETFSETRMEGVFKGGEDGKSFLVRQGQKESFSEARTGVF